MKNTKLLTGEFVIAVFDVDKFGQIAKNRNSEEIFDFLYAMSGLIAEALAPVEPLCLIPQGDTVIAAMKKEKVDEAVIAIERAKTTAENFIAEQGFHCAVSAAAHYGEATIGPASPEACTSLQIVGNEVNAVFLLLRTPSYGRFTISPILFRKLKNETRKHFFRYTPPMVYTMGKR